MSTANPAIYAQLQRTIDRTSTGTFTAHNRAARPTTPLGVDTLDRLLDGGIPQGALTELTGGACCGRTTLALHHAAQATADGKVCAWIDVSDTLDPASAAAVGVQLERMLWVRCGATPGADTRPWTRLDQALRAADLVLAGGGFGTVVLDMGSVEPKYASRVPLATWFRFRAYAEKTQASILLLTQHPCAKSSGELLLRLRTEGCRATAHTVNSGWQHRVEIGRRRFAPQPAVPIRSATAMPQAAWQSRAVWAGAR